MAITTERPEELPENIRDFGDTYYRSIFLLWYNNDKPSADRLHTMIEEPDPKTGKIPSAWTLRSWINSDKYAFKLMAAEWDQEISNKLKTEAVGEKMEMHHRHAEMGKQLAEMGIEYLEEYGIDDPKTAVRAIIAGTGLEAQSRGMDKLLETVSSMSKEKLEDEFRKALESLRAIDEGVDLLIEESTLHDYTEGESQTEAGSDNSGI